MQRFYYSAIRDSNECEGIIRADSIDSARNKLIEQGYEDITLSILSSSDIELDANPDEFTDLQASP